MSVDRELSTTDDLAFAACCLYAFGEGSLRMIDSSGRLAVFSFRVESEDFAILRSEFDTDTLAVQVFTYCKLFAKLSRLVRVARNNNNQWVSQQGRDGQ
jgi:hypothetical protein